MKQTEILQSLKQMTNAERLTIAEAALRLIREEQQTLTKDEKKRQLAVAAEAAIPDYAEGSELTIFTDLNSEDFYDYEDYVGEESGA